VNEFFNWLLRVPPPPSFPKVQLSSSSSFLFGEKKTTPAGSRKTEAASRKFQELDRFGPVETGSQQKAKRCGGFRQATFPESANLLKSYFRRQKKSARVFSVDFILAN
jgi:hypothetical protein